MKLPMRNTPPDQGIRVPLPVLQQLVRDLFTQAGMPASDADRMGYILAHTDLRCVYSHGTRQTVGYIREIQEGRVNPRPEITTVKVNLQMRYIHSIHRSMKLWSFNIFVQSSLCNSNSRSFAF